jgi:hypothetical protein
MAGTEITDPERAAAIAADVFAAPVKDMAVASRGTRSKPAPEARVARLGRTVVVEVDGPARVFTFEREAEAVSRYRREARAIGVLIPSH